MYLFNLYLVMTLMAYISLICLHGNTFYPPLVRVTITFQHSYFLSTIIQHLIHCCLGLSYLLLWLPSVLYSWPTICQAIPIITHVTWWSIISTIQHNKLYLPAAAAAAAGLVALLC